MNNNIKMLTETKKDVAPKPSLSTFNNQDLKIKKERKMLDLSMVSMATGWRSLKRDRERQSSLESAGPPPHQIPAAAFRQPAIKVRGNSKQSGESEKISRPIMYQPAGV